jgi:hypothetical protein
MTDRDDLVTKLVSTGHLGVEERRELGPGVTRGEIRRIILRELEAHGHFPPHARPWSPDQACFEGWQLQKLERGARLLSQRSYAWNSSALADSTHEDFDTVRQALERYLALAVGGDVDGVPVLSRWPPWSGDDEK